jgi:hypothetical protein
VAELLQLLQTLLQLVVLLGTFLWVLVTLLAPWALLIAWLAWWLLAVNWRRTWAFLAEGAWIPVVLLAGLAAHVWASLAPSTLSLGIVTVPNFWWQLGGVALLVGSALFCGWLQTVFGWGPPEISLEPPPPAADAHAHH